MTGYLRVLVPLLLSNLLTNKVFNKPWDQFLCEMVRFRVLHGVSLTGGWGDFLEIALKGGGQYNRWGASWTGWTMIFDAGVTIFPQESSKHEFFF